MGTWGACPSQPQPETATASCFVWQEFEYLAELLRSSGYRQNELESAVAAAVPVTWSADKQKELIGRLAVYCKPPTPAAPGSGKPKSMMGFL